MGHLTNLKSINRRKINPNSKKREPPSTFTLNSATQLSSFTLYLFVSFHSHSHTIITQKYLQAHHEEHQKFNWRQSKHTPETTKIMKYNSKQTITINRKQRAPIMENESKRILNQSVWWCWWILKLVDIAIWVLLCGVDGADTDRKRGVVTSLLHSM